MERLGSDGAGMMSTGIRFQEFVSESGRLPNAIGGAASARAPRSPVNGSQTLPELAVAREQNAGV